MDVSPPYPGVVEAMRALTDAGYHIVILTSRLSPTWWAYEAKHRKNVAPEAFGLWQTNYVINYFRTYGIPYERVTSGKVQSICYVDDRGVHAGPGELPEILTRLLEDGHVF